MRLGALARLIGDDLPARRPDLAVAGHSVGVRANSIVVDGEVRDVSPSGMALMHARRQPGRGGVPGSSCCGCCP